MNFLLQKMMLSCKKATELVEKQNVGKLKTVESFQLKLHLSMCKFCNDYSKKSQSINKLLDSFFNNKKVEDAFSDNKLSNSEKQKIKESLK